jgi:hypothetical protein
LQQKIIQFIHISDFTKMNEFFALDVMTTFQWVRETLGDAQLKLDGAVHCTTNTGMIS